LISLAYVCVQIFYKHIEYTVFAPEYETKKNIIQIDKPENITKKNSSNQSKKIIQRNIFKASIDSNKIQKKETPLQPSPENLKKTDFNLTLWGTVIGLVNTYAVIEDNKIKLQELYQVGDKLQKATIKRILKNQVILTYNGQDFYLDMDMKHVATSNASNNMNEASLNPDPEYIMVDQTRIKSSIKNINDLKRQIQMRPLIHDGESEGLLVYRIQPKSLFHTLGLRNGDVLKKVNNNALTSLEDAIKFYQTLEDTSEVEISLLRKGVEQKIIYQSTQDGIDN